MPAAGRFLVPGFRPRSIALPLILAVAAVGSALRAQQPKPAPLTVVILSEAHVKAQRGDYAGAEPVYRKLLGDSTTREEGAVGLADILLMTGRYDEARDTLETTSKDLPKSARIRAKFGEYYELVGRYEDALAQYVAGKESDPENLACRKGAAEVLFVFGKRDEAIEELKWFERFSKAAFNPKTAADMVVAGQAIDRLAVETGRRSFYSKFILNDLYGKAEQADKNCWQSRLAQGQILGSRYNFPQATKELQDCLKMNPKAVQAHVDLADMALDQWRFEEVEKRLTEVFKANPKHLAGLHLKAAFKLQERRHEDALTAAQDALTVNPNHPVGLGLAAAAAKLIPDMPRYEQFLARARKVNPHPVDTYVTIGSMLASERQFDDAQEMFDLALKAAPKLSTAWYAKGMAYMQTGHEKEAHETLSQAYDMDRFNHRTFNTLNLLDRLLKFQNIETEHFIVRFDAKEDGVVGKQFAELLESIYPDLTDLFKHKPKVKTLVEILPEHTQFGVRLTGLPQIHTVGACTGNVIAMDTPSTRPLGSPTPFNWGQVLRHEYTHTLTLSATENRIAHWFTEGLAVWSERRQRSWQWQQMLVQQLQADGLFKLQQINWGFIRPRRPMDRQLAYAQGEWMCQFIEQKWSRKHLLDMMEGFRNRKKQAQVYKEILKTDEDAFFKDFIEWAKKDVEKWGFRFDPKPRAVEELTKLVEKDGKNAELWMELSRAHAQAKDAAKSLEAARKARELDPKSAATLDRLARTLTAAKDKKSQEEAAGLWRQLFEENPKSAAAAERVAVEMLKKKEYEKAKPACERLTQLMPGNPTGWQGLMAIHQAADNADGIAECHKRLMPLEESNEKHVQYLAAYHNERERHPEAIEYYHKVLEIDPFDVNAHVSIGDLWLKRTDKPEAERFAPAERAYKLALESREIENNARRLRGRQPELRGEAYCHMRLAKLYANLNRRDDAKRHAQTALKMDAESGAKELLETLK